MKKKLYRNIGICAHIDAGKTTLTERILYFTGKTHIIGEVHNGESKMDWMDQEKERGITINAASTTVFWKNKNKINYKINIIDTPGHIDFTAEVEKSIRILDGICIVICAVAGIQAQTETIWKQVNKYNIPKIIFINKMDRKGLQYKKIIKEINIKFKIEPLVLYKPLFKNNKFIGLIDIIENNIIIYNNFELTIKKNNKFNINKNKNKLIEQLIHNDDKYIEKYLNNKLSNDIIYKIIRKKTIKNKIVPIIFGSAFKNKGIQTLLDAIINYLPSPIEKKYIYLYNNHNNKKKKFIINNDIFIGLIFKTEKNIYLGNISYIRIYSGNIKLNDIIFNINKNKTEKINKIIEIHANNKKEIKKGSYGDIIALTGLKTSSIGDTISNNKIEYQLEKINFKQPVIDIMIKPINKKDKEKLINIIKINKILDPSINIKINNKNEIIISGMGELHIDILLEKIKRENNINIIKFKPQVSYKETITKESINIEGKYIKQTGGRGQYGHVIINTKPRKINSGIKFVNKIKGGIIPKEYIKIIEKKIIKLCKKGILYGYNITDILIELVNGSYHDIDSSEIAYEKATEIAFKKAINEGKQILLEPIMLVTIIIKEEYTNDIYGNILSKRGKIIKIEKDNNIIKALIPMNELFNYSNIIRSKTKGSGEFTMEFYCYKIIPKGTKINI